MNNDTLTFSWQENQQTVTARWLTANGLPVPKKYRLVDDTIKADQAYRLMCEGYYLIWRSDFQNARQLLQALNRRVQRKAIPRSDVPRETFHLLRKTQAERARILGRLLISMQPDYHIDLPRAPKVKTACEQAYGDAPQASVISLRELQGLIGAWQWREKGVYIPPLDNYIHPYYGVFSPIRGEYLQLIAEAPLPSSELAIDIGTGSGVIAAILARRGVKRIIATETNQAVACARDNLQRLHLQPQVEVQTLNMFPQQQAPLIVCNPPWIPARTNAVIEQAIYDPDSQMLRSYLQGLAQHLTDEGEGWLVMSNIAELLGLRESHCLQQYIDQGGLTVIDKRDIQPQHKKTANKNDPLYQARRQEVTSLWRLAKKT